MFLKHQISILISEGSCDTEDWSNDANNSALPSQEIYIYIYIYTPTHTQRVYLQKQITQIIFKKHVFYYVIMFLLY